VLFLTGMLVSKGATLSPPLLGYLCFVTSILTYFMAYLFWQMAIFHTESDELKQAVKPQTVRLLYNPEYSLSASLGCIACFMALCSIASPALLSVAGWLFVMSNLSWFFAEYKIKQRFDFLKPTKQDKNAQSHFFRYIQVATFGSFLSALNLTISLISTQFPITLLGSLFFYAIATANIWGLYELGMVAYISSKEDPEIEEITKLTPTLKTATDAKSVRETSVKPFKIQTASARASNANPHSSTISSKCLFFSPLTFCTKKDKKDEFSPRFSP
jgi:hypothetical protein